MPSHSPAPSPDIVDSWKEIAAYLNHDVRTVMRWEQTRGMPVHRLPGESKSAVHALKSELDAWRKSRRIHALEVGGGPERGLPSPAPGAPSIAVLPFLNLSADKENEYFSDGLADEIITALTRIQGLRVTARTSSFAFRGKEQDVREIGARLGVSTLLEGSVQRSGDRIRISAQLVGAADGFHLWSEHYDRALAEIFALQEEVAASIAAALKLEVGSQAAPARPANLEAHNLWLRGRYYRYSRRSMQDFAKAAVCFSQAVVLDPNYAEAHLGLAQHSLDLAAYGLVSPRQVAAQGRAEVEKALQLDGQLGEAHATLGAYRALFDFDWPGAESAYVKGLACDPGSALAHRGLALSVLMPMGRLEEAEAEVRRALELDPLSPESHFITAMALFFRRRYDRAESSIRTAIELGAGHPFCEWIRGVIQALQGRLDEAVESCESAVRQFGTIPMLSAGLGTIYGWAGRTEEARRVLDQLEAAARVAYVSPIHRAWVYMGLGETDSAFTWLDRAIDARDPHVLHLSVKPVYDGLRQDPRFTALLRKMRLA